MCRKQTVEKTRGYKKGLKDMNSKLADRPFLFEQVAQVRSTVNNPAEVLLF